MQGISGNLDILAKGREQRVHGPWAKDDEVVDVHANDNVVFFVQLANVCGRSAVERLEIKGDELCLEPVMPEVSGV